MDKTTYLQRLAKDKTFEVRFGIEKVRVTFKAGSVEPDEGEILEAACEACPFNSTTIEEVDH